MADCSAPVRAGTLGYRGRDAALSAVQHVPVLGDVAAHTAWESVYEPYLGPLAAFILNNAVQIGPVPA